MFEVIYRFDPSQPALRQAPADADEARRRLEEGNQEFASILDVPTGSSPAGSRVIPFDLEDIGMVSAGGAPRQEPFAVVVGCSDARVPTELIFNRACNELFVVRVAGNVVGQEGLGSIDYAVDQLGASLRLLVVLGHSQCGAVSAAVDAFLRPAHYLAVASSHALRSVVNGLLPAVRGVAVALSRTWGEEVVRAPGYRAALIDVAIAFNAALTAAMLRQEFGDALAHGVRVVFGVYDLVTRRVGVPHLVKAAGDHAYRLIEPPADEAGYVQLGADVAAGARAEGLLKGGCH
jgi:carbonic anhydrase